MATQCGLTIVKQFTYRGATEEFSNQYWFLGTVPADDTAWNALRAFVGGKELLCVPNTVTAIRAYGYNSDADDATAVWVQSGSLGTGSLVTTGGVAAPGDSAVWVRWKTGRLNSKGRAIYLRKYYHPAVATTGSPDDVLAAQTTALDGLGLALRDGTAPGGLTISARGHNDVVSSHLSSAWITTRTLHRRGKRPGA